MRLELPVDAPRARCPPTSGSQRVQKGAADPDLVALYFQYGRYLLIASSRPGSMPANLQGIWNDSLTPPWGSKYTININTEMNYWPAETCNLSECTSRCSTCSRTAREDGRRVAKFYYGAGGIRPPSQHRPVGRRGADRRRRSSASGRWARRGCRSTWRSTTTSRATASSSPQRAYPIMKEAAQFFLDYLVDDGKGHLVTGPSLSPENTYRRPSGERAVLTMGPTMDTEILQQFFGRLIEASDILEIDAGVPREGRGGARQAACR